MSEAEFATLTEAARRAGVSSVGELIRAQTLSSCGGVNTPDGEKRISA
jgi:hypothetical protein